MANRNQTEPATRKGAECPSCGSDRIETTQEVEKFTYGTQSDAVELSATIPVRTCAQCGFQFTDSHAEEAHHEAVCHHLGVLTPREIIALRSRYGLSRSEFAAITRIGEASLYRWETGQLIQNPGYDQLLYLLTFPSNMERLRERGAKSDHEVADPVEPSIKFPNVIDIGLARQHASAFRLRKTGT